MTTESENCSAVAFAAAVIDVNNVVWTLSRPTVGVFHRLAALVPVVRALRECGISEVVAVADANIGHLVADAGQSTSSGVPDVLKGSIDRFIVVAAGEPADRTILNLARERDAWIVSNDHFREWKRRDRWVKRNAWKRRVTVQPGGEGGPDSISLRFPV